MTSARIRGQETSVVLIQDGNPVDEITTIQNHEFTYMTERKEEGYIGETSNRFDTIFNGVSGKMDLHFSSSKVFDVFASIIEKAARRVPGTRFNIKTTMNFVDGSRARVIMRDVEFGNIPVNFGSRSDYGKISLDYACSSAQTINV
jgi:hypothetical protein